MNKLRIMVLLLITVVLVGCEENKVYTYDDIWDEVVDIEFGAVNFMGESIYFYEEDNTYYCDFWMSGSGVPVIYFYTSEVEFDEDGNIVMNVPTIMMGGTFKSYEQTIEEIIVEYIDGAIYLNDVEYLERDWSSREQALDWINPGD